MAVLGIDPGLRGGIALLDGGILEAWPTPTLRRVRSKLDYDVQGMARILRRRRIDHAVLELAGARPGQGVTSMFRFGVGFGTWRGLLAALGIPWAEVRPQEWKKWVLPGTEKDKLAAIEWCRKYHPECPLVPPGGRVPHDGMADAACLAHYGLLTLQG